MLNLLNNLFFPNLNRQLSKDLGKNNSLKHKVNLPILIQIKILNHK